MNKRPAKTPVTPADGPCPDGLKTFDVTVVETYNHHYLVYAKTKEEAKAIASAKCSSGEFDPTHDSGSEYDNSISAEETELRVVDMEPDGFIRYMGLKYPYWDLERNGDVRRVSTVALQTVLFKDGDCEEYENETARKIDEAIAYYAGNEECDTVSAVRKEVFGEENMEEME